MIVKNLKVKKMFKKGSKVTFEWASDDIKHYMDPSWKGSFLTWGKTYVLNSDQTLTFEEGDDVGKQGNTNVGWTGIVYDKFTGKCTTPSGGIHYATLKLVE